MRRKSRVMIGLAGIFMNTPRRLKTYEDIPKLKPWDIEIFFICQDLPRFQLSPSDMKKEFLKTTVHTVIEEFLKSLLSLWQ